MGVECSTPADITGMNSKERRLLENVFAGLASRSPGRTMDKKTFLDYVEFYGMFGERLFDIFDFKKNKLIDLEEFMTGIARFLSGSHEDKIQLLFRMFDLRSDGKVTLEELRTMLYSMLKHPDLQSTVSRVPSLDSEKKILVEPKSPTLKTLKQQIIKTPAKTSPPFGANRKPGIDVSLTTTKEAKEDFLLGKLSPPRVAREGSSPGKNKSFLEAEKVDDALKSVIIKKDEKETEDVAEAAEHIIEHTLLTFANGKDFLTLKEFQSWIKATPQILRFVEYQLRTHVFKKQDKPRAGYLRKRGKRMGGIHTRYCVVQDGFLYQFHNDKQMDKGLPGNAIFLKGLRITEPTGKEERGNYGILLESDQETRTFYARNAIEKKQWMEWLQLESKHEKLEDFFEKLEKVGEGRFANVYRCKHKKTGMSYAVKVIDKTTIDDADKEGLRAEIAILRLCSHPFIVSMKKVYETKKHINIVMEWMEHGDLFKEIVRKRVFSEDVGRHIIQQLCSAIRYCHIRGIVHKDIKPENILVELLDDPYIRIYVTDFGLSQFAKPSEAMKDAAGSLAYMAPEMIDKDTFDKSVDIWGIGVIAYVLLSGTMPFFDKDEIKLMDKIVKDPVEFKSKRWTKISGEAKDFIMKTLHKDPKKRLTIEQAMTHKWLQQVEALIPLLKRAKTAEKEMKEKKI
mmetsp:Transcript_16474/g.24815  ORF Transcript_16474/g.24815 Transcript_16474/m.24815 type:complete len:681 (-) Transcript_16474:109-2151(-)